MALKKETRTQRYADYVLLPLFFVMIALPLTDTLFRYAPEPATRENRPLASMPELGLDKHLLKAFPNDFESFYNDHFGFRGILIHGYNALSVQYLDVSPIHDVLAGHHGWLFPGDPDTIATTRGTDLLDEFDLQAWTGALEKRRAWLAERDIALLVVVTPNKGTVYSEYLPASVNRIGTQTQRDQFMTALRANPQIETLDLTAPLIEAKQDTPLFSKTATAWNDRGAYIAYREILTRLSAQFPLLQPEPPENFIHIRATEPGGDLAELLGLQALLTGPAYHQYRRNEPAARRTLEGILEPSTRQPESSAPYAIETPSSEAPRAILFAGGYSPALVPFLAPHFQRLTCIHTGHCDFDPALIEREHPNIVILEIAESRLIDPPPSDPLAPAY